MLQITVPEGNQCAPSSLGYAKSPVSAAFLEYDEQHNCKDYQSCSNSTYNCTNDHFLALFRVWKFRRCKPEEECASSIPIVLVLEVNQVPMPNKAATTILQNGRTLRLQLPYAPQSPYTSHCVRGWDQNKIQFSEAGTHVHCLICPFTSMVNREMIESSFMEYMK
uniref:Uncharacterized protein n=3 Tax=Oryza TaxID=4527 RepID=A0A0E0ECY7_9ORYZ